jgi:dUTP pyrophosphatase
MINVKFKKLTPYAQLPTWATKGSIGLDLYACSVDNEGRHPKVTLPPRTTRPVKTGLAFEIDGGTGEKAFYAQVVSRSGLVLRHSIMVANAPGIIDLDYRGELCILLYNGGFETYYVQHGDRIAQLLLTPAIIDHVFVAEVEELTTTDRGDKGFGSTGR